MIIFISGSWLQFTYVFIEQLLEFVLLSLSGGITKEKYHFERNCIYIVLF